MPILSWNEVAPRRSRSSKPGDGAGESAGRAISDVGNDDARAAAPVEPTRLIVGIGASAGGLDAFRAFFARMPTDTGMTLRAGSASRPQLRKLPRCDRRQLYRDARTPRRGWRRCLSEPGLYHSARRDPDHPRRHSPPYPSGAARCPPHLDQHFLVSLAQDQGKNAVGIILSGFGSDGARGVVAIKEHGGLTLSQAEFDHHAMSGMPQSAASSGFVDNVLSVDEMPVALLDYQRHRKRSDSVKGPDGVGEDLAAHLVTICAVLQSRLGRIFDRHPAEGGARPVREPPPGSDLRDRCRRPRDPSRTGRVVSGLDRS
jgi:two-component system CheB/CheR fusion protein